MKYTDSEKRLIKRIKNKVKDHLFEDGNRIKIGFSYFTDTIIKEVRRAYKKGESDGWDNAEKICVAGVKMMRDISN